MTFGCPVSAGVFAAMTFGCPVSAGVFAAMTFGCPVSTGVFAAMTFGCPVSTGVFAAMTKTTSNAGVDSSREQCKPLIQKDIAPVAGTESSNPNRSLRDQPMTIVIRSAHTGENLGIGAASRSEPRAATCRRSWSTRWSGQFGRIDDRSLRDPSRRPDSRRRHRDLGWRGDLSHLIRTLPPGPCQTRSRQLRTAESVRSGGRFIEEIYMQVRTTVYAGRLDDGQPLVEPPSN